MMGAAKLAATLALLAVLAVPEVSGAAATAGRPSARTGEVTQIDADSFQKMLEEVSALEGAVAAEDGGITRVEIATDGKVWFFTQPGHAAHPAVVSVQILREEGVPHIQTDGWRGGNRMAFDEWFTAFVRRNAHLARKWREE
ncbi:hypothetical protein [Pelagibius sp.]|uniref:hypothetical protein n=1 Tax=Pelagibius sp. TaxID=1931238 RepID=UPI003B50B61A